MLAAARQRPKELEWGSFIKHWKLVAALLLIGVIACGLLLPTLALGRRKAAALTGADFLEKLGIMYKVGLQRLRSLPL